MLQLELERRPFTSAGSRSVVRTGTPGCGERQPATPEHPFGRGKKLYLWSLIVAVLIFGLGGGMSIAEGVAHMRHPEPLTDPKLIREIARTARRRRCAAGPRGGDPRHRAVPAMVLAAGPPLTMYVGADDVLLTLDVVFADGVPAARRSRASTSVAQAHRTAGRRAGEPMSTSPSRRVLQSGSFGV